MRLSTQIVLGLIVVLCGSLYLGTVYQNVTETPQHAEARRVEQQALMERQRIQTAAAAERTNSICKVRKMCLDYGEARQQCATAGNFNLCLNVKLKTLPPPYLCNDDGTISSPPADMPNALECVGSTFGSYFK